MTTRKENKRDELAAFCKELKSYQRFLSKERLSKAQIRYRDSLREKLVRKVGKLKEVIVQLTGKQYYTQFGRSYDFWAGGLSSSGFLPFRLQSLGFCIDATIEAIGKLESTPLAALELQEVGVTQETKDATELPIYLFNNMQLHPKVIEVSRSLFADGHYKQAILEAYIALNNLVKDKSGSTLDGKALMAEVFSEKAPIIKLNDLLDRNDKDEQEGFKFLYMGAIVGVRNPKAHDNIVQSDPYRTLEYLSLVSLLMKRVDEGKVVKLRASKE